MNKQQQFLFGMMKEIHMLCVSNGIDYYIGMGTLLGAVRNGGFLPWDDDADVIMTYENFERFKEVCKTQLPEGRYLGSPDIDETYHNALARYMHKETTALHPCQSLHNGVAGEVIDIFVFDPVADGKEAFNAYMQDFMLYSTYVNYSNTMGALYEVDPERYRALLELEKEKGRTYVVKQLEEMLATHFSDDGSRLVMRWPGSPISYDRKWFESTMPIAFEGETFLAPVGAVEFLMTHYGELWFEVPSSINAAKHVTSSSLEFPYTEALEFYRPTHDREKLLQKTVERRLTSLEYAKETNALADEELAIEQRVVELETRKAVQTQRGQFDRALAERDGNALAKILKRYADFQSSPSMIGRRTMKTCRRRYNPILIDLGDELFEAMLLALLSTNRMHHVRFILGTRMAQGTPLTPLMQEIADAIKAFHESTCAYQQKDHVRGAQLVKPALDAFPQVKAFHELYCGHLSAIQLQTKAASDIAAAEQAADEALERFATEGMFLKVKADCMESRGEENTLPLYMQAAENTHNGLVLKSIAEKTGYWPSWYRNTKWGAAYGVEQWNGPDPEPIELPAKKPGAAENVQGAQTPQEYLLALLAELGKLCDDNSIRYILAPATSAVLFKHNMLPDKISQYAIICPPADCLKLVNLLKRNMPANRELEYMGNSRKTPCRDLRYFGTDSLLLNPKAQCEDRFNGLYVTIRPLEPQTYSDKLAKMLKLLDKTLGNRFSPNGTKAKLWCISHGIGKDRDQAAAKLFGLAMKEAAASNEKLFLMSGAKPRGVASKFFSKTQQREFAGYAFQIPKDIEAYYPKRKIAVKGELQLKSGVICSTSVGFDEMKDALPADHFQRCKALKEATEESRATRREFVENYNQISLAVQLKEISLELLPQKDKILELDEQQDYEELKKLLACYLRCAKKFDSVGNLSFDDDIYRIMRKLS